MKHRQTRAERRQIRPERGVDRRFTIPGLGGLALLMLLGMPRSGMAQGQRAGSPEAGGTFRGPASMPLLTRSVDPKAFGTAETYTVISAWSFTGAFFSGNTYSDDPRVSGSLGRFNNNFGNDTHYFATVDLPAGAVIDFVGINTTTDTDSIMGLALYKRDSSGSATLIGGFSIPAHGWGTDYAGPLNILVDTHQNQEFLLDVEQAPAAGFEYWAWVEIQWHRTVSPAPGAATFNDVPTSHPFFQFVEALKASGITGGCSAAPPLYCPDSPVTRGQMAVFLAKALGLNWPY